VSRNRLKPWHRDAGIGAAGAKLAEEALPLLMRACSVLGDPGFAERVLREAEFRVFELPRRSPAFQKKYLAENDIEK